MPAALSAAFAATATWLWMAAHSSKRRARSESVQSVRLPEIRVAPVTEPEYSAPGAATPGRSITRR